VKLTPQEIQQLVEWGSRNQRPLEDIQEDADWANEARGGTGAVQLPPHRRAEGGAVFFPDPADAQEYDRAHSEIAVIDAQAQDRKDRAAALERRQRYWTAWEELADWRFAAGLMDLVTVDDNLAETRASIDRQIETLNEPPNNLVWVAHEGDVLAHREPGDTWRYGGREYPDYESAMAAYDQRHQRIAELEDDKQNLASYVDIMQRKTRDPDRPVGKHEREEYRRLESSMFNRPAEKLNEIGQEQDQLQGEIKDLQGRKRAASETMHRIEQQYGAR
jgi:DNA repair exonuclease SbcCD ATPase subunit